MITIGSIIYWKTMFGEWFKGEVTGMDADNFYVTRLVPHIAYGVRVPRNSEICFGTRRLSALETEAKQAVMARQIMEAKTEGPSWGREPIEY